MAEPSLFDEHGSVRLAGIDGCKTGWAVARATVRRDDRDIAPEVSVAEDFADAVGDAHLAMVDVPIGLPDRAEPGGRACDALARRALGGRSSSVFSAPARCVLDAECYEDALERSRASSEHGLGLSKQAWNIVGKIREVDGWIDPRRQSRVRECHPEVVFAALASRSAAEREKLTASKKSVAGRSARLALLGRAGVRLPTDVNDLIRVRGAQADDIIDAVACLCGAVRLARGRARVLGGAVDGRGLRMEIVA